MDKITLDIPHSLNPVCCMVSGVSDQYEWKTGNALPRYYLFWASGMCGFAYIKNSRAVPPRMVFFGANPESQYKSICGMMNCSVVKYEGLGFASTLARIKNAVSLGFPVVIGPLDMFYLPYLKHYQTSHIPIHYIMVIGFDANGVIVYDCDREDAQPVEYDLLQQALDVHVPGVGVRNTIRIFHWPKAIPSIEEIAAKSLAEKCAFMLRPPISNLGVPGMRKLAREVLRWPEELSEEEVSASLKGMVKYMDDRFEGRSFDGGRIRFAREYLAATSEILRVAELKRLEREYRESGAILDSAAKSILRETYSFQGVSESLLRVADIEEGIYRKIEGILEGAVYG